MDTRTFLMLILPSLLFDNAEPKICSRRGLYDLHAFQFNLQLILLIGFLQGLDVNLFHLKHGFRHSLRFLRVLVLHHLD